MKNWSLGFLGYEVVVEGAGKVVQLDVVQDAVAVAIEGVEELTLVVSPDWMGLFRGYFGVI